MGKSKVVRNHTFTPPSTVTDSAPADPSPPPEPEPDTVPTETRVESDKTTPETEEVKIREGTERRQGVIPISVDENLAEDIEKHPKTQE